MTPSPRLRATITACAALLVFAGAWASARWLAAGDSAPPPPAATTADLPGRALPDTRLVDLAGAPVGLRDRVRGRPAVIYLAGVETCLDCTQFPTEMRILRREHPGLRHVFVGVGPDTAFLARYARRQRVAPETLLDPGGRLQRELGTAASLPLVLLVDADGRILLADPRGGARAAPLTISRMLLGLGGALSSTRGS